MYIHFIYSQNVLLNSFLLFKTVSQNIIFNLKFWDTFWNNMKEINRTFWIYLWLQQNNNRVNKQPENRLVTQAVTRGCCFLHILQILLQLLLQQMADKQSRYSHLTLLWRREHHNRPQIIKQQGKIFTLMLVFENLTVVRQFLGYIWPWYTCDIDPSW